MCCVAQFLIINYLTFRLSSSAKCNRLWTHAYTISSLNSSNNFVDESRRRRRCFILLTRRGTRTCVGFSFYWCYIRCDCDEPLRETPSGNLKMLIFQALGNLLILVTLCVGNTLAGTTTVNSQHVNNLFAVVYAEGPRAEICNAFQHSKPKQRPPLAQSNTPQNLERKRARPCADDVFIHASRGLYHVLCICYYQGNFLYTHVCVCDQ